MNAEKANQDWVMAQWYKHANANKPELYSVRAEKVTGHMLYKVYLSVAGNVGWFYVGIEGDKITYVRSLGMPLPIPDDDDTPEEIAAMDYQTKFIGKAQARKIIAAVDKFKNAEKLCQIKTCGIGEPVYSYTQSPLILQDSQYYLP